MDLHSTCSAAFLFFFFLLLKAAEIAALNRVYASVTWRLHSNRNASNGSRIKPELFPPAHLPDRWRRVCISTLQPRRIAGMMARIID